MWSIDVEDGAVKRPGVDLRIAELRKAKKWTQADLAKAANISRSQLSEIETGGKPANTKRLAAIAAALGVPPEDLFERGAPRDAYLMSLASIIPDLSDDDRAALLRMAHALAGRPPG
jgi:transcriptional regulator with XRE-family HTH domain